MVMKFLLPRSKFIDSKRGARQRTFYTNQNQLLTLRRAMIGGKACSLDDDIYNQPDPIRYLEATKALQIGHRCTYWEKIPSNDFDFSKTGIIGGF